MARADLEQRPPHRRPHHTHEHGVAEPAGARPRARHGRAVARSGRSRCRVRDTRDRGRARARGGWQRAQRDRARRAHARPARGRGRPGAVRPAGVEHDVDAGAARALPQRPAATRTGRRLRTGDLGERQDAACRGQADRCRARLATVRRRRTRHARNTSWRCRRCAAQPDHADRARQRRPAALPRRRRADQPRDHRTARPATRGASRSS